MKRPTMLMILDGFGMSEPRAKATPSRRPDTPALDHIFETYPTRH